MTREWRHLKMMKRAGRGHDPDGVSGTPAGACAVECPACLLPGKNLPPDYDKAPQSKRCEVDAHLFTPIHSCECYRWLYRLFLAMDANFRLKRKKVSSDAVDPSLNNGCAYMVQNQPYHAHLEKFDKLDTSKENHCNNHDAIKLATLKGAATLASTGVFSVDCARHDMKRPCSSGDLRKGER